MLAMATFQRTVRDIYLKKKQQQQQQCKPQPSDTGLKAAGVPKDADKKPEAMPLSAACKIQFN